MTVASPKLATSAVDPSGVTATASGSSPTPTFPLDPAGGRRHLDELVLGLDGDEQRGVAGHSARADGRVPDDDRTDRRRRWRCHRGDTQSPGWRRWPRRPRRRRRPPRRGRPPPWSNRPGRRPARPATRRAPRTGLMRGRSVAVGPGAPADRRGSARRCPVIPGSRPPRAPRRRRATRLVGHGEEVAGGRSCS